MKANALKGEELYNETVELYNETKENIEEIRNSKYRLEEDAVGVWDKLNSKTTKNIDDMNEEELRSLYRELKYINNLKSSTLQGAEEAYNMFKDIESTINSLSPTVQKQFWNVYKRLYDENTNIGQAMYKYDVLREISTVVEQASNKSQSLSNIEYTLSKVIELISGNNVIDIHQEVEREKGREFESSKIDYKDELFMRGFNQW